MSTRPIIFISAVSKELHSARDHVAKTLLSLGYDPKWQDIAPTETGMLPQVLRDWIDQSDAVIQLVGHHYGFAPKEPDAEFGECSYTQLEALYARQLGKKVWYLILTPEHPTDPCAAEASALRELQDAYRTKVTGTAHLYHSSNSLDKTELIVHRIKDELALLRRRTRRQAALVLGLLVVLVLGGVWIKHDLSYQHQASTDTLQRVDVLHEDNARQAQALADLRQMLETSIKGGSESKLAADYDAALRFIAQKRGIGLAAFSAFLEKNATQALDNAAVSLKDRVRALQEAGQFVQSRDFALQQARRLETDRQKSSKEEVELWTEAAKAELTLGHYAKALEYATKAVSQTDSQADFPTWSAARHQQGWALIRLRKNKEAETLYEELISLQQAAFGADSLAVLQSRRNLAISIYDQGNHALAEQKERVLVADCQRVLGVEHLDTLSCRNNLAIALRAQGKHADAEQGYRAVLQIRERVQGAEHPDTLTSRMNLAIALRAQGKYAEAEQEMRTVLQIQERVQGAEHPNTLTTRMSLANALAAQGKYAEAEPEMRAVLEVRERVLEKEHPDVALTCYNLARCLEDEQKLPEALKYIQRADLVSTKILGPAHPDTQLAKAARERIEAALK